MFVVYVYAPITTLADGRGLHLEQACTCRMSVETIAIDPLAKTFHPTSPV